MSKKIFNVGDSVQWMRVSGSGSRWSFSQREGVIAELFANAAMVKMRNGRKVQVWFDDLRHSHEKGQVTEVFEKLVDRSAE